jgi:hypothetical protein
MTTSIPETYQSLKTKLETIVKKIISPKTITENEDLDDYTEVGMYYCPYSTVATTLTNCPVTNAFSLFVEKSSGYENACTQLITSYDGTRIKKFSRFIQTVDGTFQDSGWQPLYEDTGWQDVTFKSGFSHYSDSNDYRVRYRRIGKIVELRGSVRNTNKLTANTDYVMATITDTTCRPDGWVTYVQQGSGMNKLLITIRSDGQIVVNRYGTTAYSDIPSGTWINVHTTFLVD